MEQVWFDAALWVGLALIAALISMRLALAVALVEIVLGAIAGNTFGLHTTGWSGYLADVGAVLVVFLAGAEIDMRALRKNAAPSLAIGLACFLVPLIGAALVARFVLGWQWPAALVAATATSTTSVVVVYAVAVETGLVRYSLGQVMIAACFLSNFGAMLTLGVLFTAPDPWLMALIAALTATFFIGGRFARTLFGDRETRSEPEIRFLLLVLSLLGAVGGLGGVQAVLPAFIAGVALAPFLAGRPEVAQRVRTVAFAVFTPFFFLKAGTLLDAHVLLQSGGAVLILLLTRIAAKLAGVLPVAAYFRYPPRTIWFTAFVMSTGLTFDVIIALFGFDHGLIDRSMYGVIVTVAIISAVVPTLIAQAWFKPNLAALAEREAAG